MYGSDAMNIHIKKFTASMFVLAITVFLISYAAYADYDVRILVEGDELSCSQSPVIKDGVTFIPLRDVFEGVGAEVLWDNDNRCAVSVEGDTVVEVYPDSGILLKNGDKKELPGKPFIQNDKIMIPLRAVAESFGYTVLWRGKDYTVSISRNPLLRVHFLDAGQADSIFTELPDGKCMLIDSGESSFGKELEKFIRNLGYSHIDYVVATHPHSDHIGSMDYILKKFSVGSFYMPNVTHTTKTFERMIDALSENGCKCEYIELGSKISSSPCKIEVLSPQNKEYIRMNNYSAVIKLTYENSSVLFSADAEALAEEDMIRKNLDLSADILKIGHHGSGTSSVENYLDKVSALDAVISVGEGNSYGFPSPIVLGHLLERGVSVHRTDLKGNITAVSDGYLCAVD